MTLPLRAVGARVGRTNNGRVANRSRVGAGGGEDALARVDVSPLDMRDWTPDQLDRLAAMIRDEMW